MGIVFDKESRTLFWADTLNETIAKMHVSQSDEPSSPIVLHNLAGNSPRGVALDVCNRCAICDILRQGDSSSSSLISSHSPGKANNRKNVNYNVRNNNQKLPKSQKMIYNVYLLQF